jgi:hypothetical protein
MVILVQCATTTGHFVKLFGYNLQLIFYDIQNKDSQLNDIQQIKIQQCSILTRQHKW